MKTSVRYQKRSGAAGAVCKRRNKRLLQRTKLWRQPQAPRLVPPAPGTCGPQAGVPHPISSPSTPSSPRYLPFLPATKASRLPGLVLSSPHSTSLCTICSSNNLSGDQPLSLQVTFEPQHARFLQPASFCSLSAASCPS